MTLILNNFVRKLLLKVTFTGY